MRRLAAFAVLGMSLACGSGPQQDDDTANDTPPMLITVTEVIRDDCGLGAPAFDGPYLRRPREDGGFELQWDSTIGWGAPAQPAYMCERDLDAFACWPTPSSLLPDATPLPPNTVVWLRGELHGDDLSGEATLRITCDRLVPTCVVEDTGREIQAPCETVFAFEGTAPEVHRTGRCPDEELVPVTEPAEVYVYNYTGKTWYGRVATPDGLGNVAVPSAIGPTMINAWQGGFLAFTGTSMSDTECTGAAPIDAARVFVELRGRP